MLASWKLWRVEKFEYAVYLEMHVFAYFCSAVSENCRLHLVITRQNVFLHQSSGLCFFV